MMFPPEESFPPNQVVVPHNWNCYTSPQEYLRRYWGDSEWSGFVQGLLDLSCSRSSWTCFELNGEVMNTTFRTICFRYKHFTFVLLVFAIQVAVASRVLPAPLVCGSHLWFFFWSIDYDSHIQNVPIDPEHRSNLIRDTQMICRCFCQHHCFHICFFYFSEFVSAFE